MSVVDLNAGQPEEVKLHNGASARVELLERTEICDNVRGAVRNARARVKVNGREVRLDCGNYNLPVAVAGVQVDCAVTKGFLGNSRDNPWGLAKDARLRLWPAGSAFMASGTYVYPVKQRWFATTTQMANQPSFVDGSETPWGRRIYYHYGLDTGGAEGLTEVVSATRGLVVVRGQSAMPGYEKNPCTEVSYDGVIVLDERGWYHWYFHLFSIDPGVKLGEAVATGQRIGLVGKEGSAGCWSHLHYEIRGPQPSGKAGIVEGYAFLWEAYQRQYGPDVVAVARPHSYAWVGETVTLDGTRSWSRSGRIVRYEWTFGDGSKAGGPTVSRMYGKPGTYSEILKVTDRPRPQRLRFRRRSDCRQAGLRTTGRGKPGSYHSCLVLADTRCARRAARHLSGPHVPDDTRPGDLGLWRRLRAGDGEIGRMYERESQGRLRPHAACFPATRRLSRESGACERTRREGDRPPVGSRAQVLKEVAQGLPPSPAEMPVPGDALQRRSIT